MAARKKRPVLYEVVNRSRRRRGHPVSRRSDQTPPPPATETPEPAPSAPEPNTPEPTEDIPFMQVAEGRVYLSLGWPHMLAAGAILIAIGVGLFQAGLRSALPPSPSPAEESFLDEGYESTPADTESPAVVDPHQRGNSGNIATPTPGAPPRTVEPLQPTPREATRRDSSAPPSIDSLNSGNYHVVVQHFRSRDLDTARQARDFLRSNGVPCEVYRGHGDYMLVATDAFNTQSAARGLVRRIRELGDEYLRGGGGYDFGGAQPRRF